MKNMEFGLKWIHTGVCKINGDLQNVQFHVHGPPLPITMLNREDLPRDLRRIHVYFAAPCTHSFQLYFQHCGGGTGLRHDAHFETHVYFADTGMARYELTFRLDRALWLPIISGPLLTQKWPIQIQQ